MLVAQSFEIQYISQFFLPFQKPLELKFTYVSFMYQVSLPLKIIHFRQKSHRRGNISVSHMQVKHNRSWLGTIGWTLYFGIMGSQC